MSGVSSFLEKIQKFLERGGIVAHMPDNALEIFYDLGGVFGEQVIGVLIVDLERVLILAGLHESIGEGGDSGKIVVDGLELGGQRAGIGEASGFEVGLE